MNRSYPVFQMWWRYRRLAYQSRRWLKGNGPARTAAFAMFHLNHIAGSGRSRYMIYGLKTMFIRHLYETGYCTAVSLQKQTQECWSCNGTGLWDGHGTRSLRDTCWKCGGTGIYREHTLYRFVFDVDGRTYIWHQPQTFVDWPVQLTELGFSAYDGRRLPQQAIPAEIGELYLTVLLVYLKQNGIAIPDGGRYGFTSFSYATRAEWRELRWYWRRWVRGTRPYRWRGNLRRLLSLWQTGELPENDDIPF